MHWSVLHTLVMADQRILLSAGIRLSAQAPADTSKTGFIIHAEFLDFEKKKASWNSQYLRGTSDPSQEHFTFCDSAAITGLRSGAEIRHARLSKGTARRSSVIRSITTARSSRRSWYRMSRSTIMAGSYLPISYSTISKRDRQLSDRRPADSEPVRAYRAKHMV